MLCYHYRAKRKSATEAEGENDNSANNVPNQSMYPRRDDKDRRSSRVHASRMPLVVRIPFPQRKKSEKKQPKCLSKAYKKIGKLHTDNQKLTQRLKRVQKRNERLKVKLSEASASSVKKSIAKMTPRSKTKTEIKQAGLKAKDLPRSIKKKLTFANAVAAQFKQTYHETRKQSIQRSLRCTIAGKVVKKYKCISTLHKETGIRRCTLATEVAQRRVRGGTLRAFLQDRILSYFERDDVSRMMPGKKDATKGKQNRILTDYLSNLHARFCSENIDIAVSFTTFCRLRPSHIKLTSMLSRNTCLCTIHQNMALKMRSLRTYGLEVSLNPETTSEKVAPPKMAELLSQLETETSIIYQEWRKVEINGVKKMRILSVTKTPKEFIETMNKDYMAFQDHVSRLRQQYKALRDLKNGLPQHHVIVQMDFAENYACQNVEEIQSAYWNGTSVTLHPVVAYYKDDNDKLQHKSYVFLSPLGEHNAKTVVTIIDKLIPLLKEQVPGMNCIHYWTDSPTSQYRNRYIFSLLCKHQDMYGLTACWNFFESGHGKSVCDGIGGVAKRQASDAVKQGKVIIQDADDFFAWASSNQKGLTYVMYTKGEYDKASEFVATIDCRPLPGTQKLHAVVPINNSEVLVRAVSCYCEGCLDGSRRCDGWLRRSLKPKKSKPKDAVGDATGEENGDVPVKVGEYIAAMYEDSWYIGRVLEVDKEDQDTKITFMTTVPTKQRPTFKWGVPADEIWIPFTDILTAIEAPDSIGKSGRFYQVSTETLNLIEKLKTDAMDKAAKSP